MSEQNTVPEEAFSSNMAMMPLRKALRSAPHILPKSGVTPLRELFSFATLTQSIARMSGELAASAVAGYQNHYGDPLCWKRVGEKNSFGWKSEWEEDMRALEMDQWIPDRNALWSDWCLFSLPFLVVAEQVVFVRLFIWGFVIVLMYYLYYYECDDTSSWNA
jgi:hypothetical protein